MSRTIAAAQTLACALAANPAFGIAPAMQASPMTWILGCRVDSKLNDSTGHQPVRSATPAISAMRPAFCGGTILATAAWYLAKSVSTVMDAASTCVTLPRDDSDTHSMRLG